MGVIFQVFFFFLFLQNKFKFVLVLTRTSFALSKYTFDKPVYPLFSQEEGINLQESIFETNQKVATI